MNNKEWASGTTGPDYHLFAGPVMVHREAEAQS